MNADTSGLGLNWGSSHGGMMDEHRGILVNEEVLYRVSCALQIVLIVMTIQKKPINRLAVV
jgi:hypothetical protein